MMQWWTNIKYTMSWNTFVADLYNDGSAQDCSNSISNAMELLHVVLHQAANIYLPVRFSPYTIGNFSWFYFLPITSNIFTKPIMATHYFLWKNGWNNADGFWQMQVF